MNPFRSLEKKYPKILVISNNAFSMTTNNGKTLASFFIDFPPENISQLYFNEELSDCEQFNDFFRITDKDVLNNLLKNNKECGRSVKPRAKAEVAELLVKSGRKSVNRSIFNAIKGYSIFRILREILWSCGKWNEHKLNNWIEKNSPDIIFFCAGDSGFAHDIAKYIQKSTGAKLIVYITDDYVLPRKSYSPFWQYRRKYIFNKMSCSIQRSDLLITISNKMSVEYKRLFNKESIQAINMTVPLKSNDYKVNNSTDLILVYAGGFHFKRYLTLNLLANALKKYNSRTEKSKKAYLKIYSNQKPSKKILKFLNVNNASEFCGELNLVELKRVLNECDIPVHVESFDNKSISSTLLSISTKIPEYLSLGKTILAIGPAQVASIEYLQESAYCVVDKKNINIAVESLLDNDLLRKDLAKQALTKYENNHQRRIVLENFMENIMKLYEGNLV